jgi:hypothetical protein
MWSNRGSEGLGLVRIANCDRYCFNEVKVAACSGPHAKSFAPQSVLRKGRLHSADLEMNLLRAANLPVSRWTSLADWGGVILMMAWILVGLASIPQCDTR